MSQLTNQQINNTYQGLIKLADSTTGVTSSLQSIQDGLGNDLPMKVSSGVFMTNVDMSYPKYGVGDFYGSGVALTSAAPVANTQNLMVALPFYDRGELSYSGISYQLITASTTSDIVNVSFYSSQWVDGYGLAPYEVVMSGMTFKSTGSTGFNTDTFVSPLSFSGNGPGIYWLVYQIQNSGVTPTVRYSLPSTYSENLVSTVVQSFGYVFNANGVYVTPWDGPSTSPTAQITYNFTTYPNPFTASDVANTVTTLTNRYGFVLRTLK